MQEPCVEETALVQAPLRKLMERLRVLLDEWPDHPILAQLAAICSRVLNFPLSSPVKAVLTGLELVLSRAQVRIFHGWR